MRAIVPDAVEGTRGLLWANGLLLLAAMLEPALPAGFPRWLVTIPALLLLLAGLVTLPWEGLAAQQRAREHAAARDWRPIAKHLAWLGVTVALLLPRLFLGAYGVPHLNPLVGIVPQQWLVRAATVFLFVVLLAPLLYLRGGRLGAAWPTVPAGTRSGPGLRGRDTLLVGLALLLAAWAFVLHPFWAPFSLLQWPPALWSLTAGARGMAALAFALIPPAVYFLALTAQATLVKALLEQTRDATRDRCLAAALAHVLLTLTAAFLHGYDLLWIARYESLAQF